MGMLLKADLYLHDPFRAVAPGTASPTCPMHVHVLAVPRSRSFAVLHAACAL